jgi:PAS domain S-box-containing protein
MNEAPPPGPDLRTAITESAEGFALLDEGAVFTFVNRELARIAEQPVSALIGKCVWTLFPSRVGTPLHAAFQRVVSERQPVELEHSSSHAGRRYAVRFTPTRGGVAVALRDITIGRTTEASARERNQYENRCSPVFGSSTTSPCRVTQKTNRWPCTVAATGVQ